MILPRHVPVLILAALAAALTPSQVALAEDPATTFSAPASTTGTNDPVAVAAADFEGDGDIDLLFLDGTLALVKIRRNEGDGVTYATSGFTVTGATVRDAAVGDMDGDGDPDVVIATSAGILVARNDGLSGAAIAFTQATPVLPSANTSPTRVALGDYDADGDLDVVSCGGYSDMVFPAGGYVGVQLNSGGAIGPGVIEPRTSEPDGIATGDFNADGRVEIVFVDDRGSEVSSERWVYRNPGPGILLTSGERFALSGTANPRDCRIADLTGDGRPDLLVSGWGEYTQGQNRGEFTIYRNAGTNQSWFFVAELRVIHTFPSGTFAGGMNYPVAVADVNGGGVPDIVTLSPLEDVVKVFHYTIQTDGDGFVGLVPGEVTSHAAGESPRRLVVAQLNAAADAKPDVAVAIPNAPAAILLNSTTGGGGGEPLRGALGLKAQSKAVKGDYQDGAKWKFTCVQPEDDEGLTVRVQSTLTPDQEGSWQDLPGAPTMTRGKKGKYSLTVFSVPSGMRYFRTVTAAPGRVDGINTSPTGLDAYIGPFNIVSGGPSLHLTAEIIPASDAVNRRRTFPGDLIAFYFTTRNTGTATARGVTVEARIPRQVSLFGYLPEENAELQNAGSRIQWTVGDLAPDAEAEMSFGVIVDADASGAIVFESMSTSAENVKSATRDPPGRVEIEIGSPLSLAVAARTGEPDVGGPMSWSLVASNAGLSTFGNAVVMDRLPTGTAFDVAYFTDGNGNPVGSPVAGPGGRSNPYYDRAARRVYWYLGDLEGAETVHLRLDTTVQHDVAPGSTIVNGAWQLRAANPGGAGDPLQFERLPADSGEPSDVEVTTSDDEPSGSPVLRLSQFADVPGRPGSVFDRTYGAVTTVVPGGRLKHAFIVQNSGGAEAGNVRLYGNIAHDTTYSAPEGVKVTNLDGGGVGQATVTLSSGGTLEAVLGDVPAGSAYLVEYFVDVSDRAKAGETIAFLGFNLRTDSLSEPIFAGPDQLLVRVSQAFAPAITVVGPPAGAEGEFLCYAASLSNAGDVPGTSCRVTLTVPKGMKMADDPSDGFTGGAALYDHDGLEIQVLPVDASAKSVTFQIANARAGDVGTAVLCVQVIKRQPSVVVPCTGTFTGTTANGKAAGKQASAEFSTSTAVLGQAELVLHRHAPIASSKRLEFGYILGVSNTTDIDALDVRASFSSPPGTRLAGSPTSDPEAKVRGQDVTWKLGTVAAHTTRLLRVQVQVDDETPGPAVVEDSFTAESSNATVRLPDPTATVALTPDRRFETFRWPALSALLAARGMKLDAEHGAKLDGLVQGLNSAGLNSSVAAGMIQLKDGAFMLPIGGGQIVAAGAGNIVAAGAGNIVAAGAGNIVAAGAGNLTTFNVAGVGVLDASQLIARHADIVAAGAGNIVAAGAGNLIGLDGGSLIGLDGGSILAQLSPLLSSNLVAAGAGNIVAAGAGNIVAAGAGNLVAAGGGNAVAANVANLRSSLGASLVAAGGGNIVAAGGLNMVAAGAGNLVAAGAGNIVAAGAGNIVAAGGLNKAPRTVMIRARGLPQEP